MSSATFKITRSGQRAFANVGSISAFNPRCAQGTLLPAPYIKGYHLHPLFLPIFRGSKFREESLKIGSPRILAVWVGSSRACHDKVAMIQTLARNGYADRRVTRRQNPNPGAVVRWQMRSWRGRRRLVVIDHFSSIGDQRTGPAVHRCAQVKL